MRIAGAEIPAPAIRLLWLLGEATGHISIDPTAARYRVLGGSWIGEQLVRPLSTQS